MNIAAIVNEYIYLKPLGEDFVGRCPFCLYHQRQFVVSPQLKTYECLHCGQTGGALDFIRRMDTIIQWNFQRSQKKQPKHIIGTVYVLLLEGGHYYIGFTQDLQQRLKQHFAHKGALWTKKHHPVRLIDVYYDVPEFAEHRITKLYIQRFGAAIVRGGNHLDARDEPHPYSYYPKRFSPNRRTKSVDRLPD